MPHGLPLPVLSPGLLLNRSIISLRPRTRKLFSRQLHPPRIRSNEHEGIFPESLGADIAQTHWQTSTAGAEFMDSPQEALKAALEAIRDMASNALSQSGPCPEERSMRWRCKACRYTKHFTKTVPLEAAGRCPRCKNTEFRPIL